MVGPAGSRGFSLIEVIIAVAILAFSLLGIVPLLVNSMQINTATSIDSRAQILAAQKLQELQTWPEVDITNSGCLDVSDWCNEGVVDTVYGVNISRLYRFDTVSVTAANIPESYIITVRVSYILRNSPVTKTFTTTWIRP